MFSSVVAFVRLRRWWVASAAVVVAAGVALGWVLWPDPEPEAPRARQYRDIDACLLTDSRGVAGAEAAPVWAGMQEASLATLVRVSSVAVVDPQTPENAAPFLAGLAQRHCSVVFVVGEAPVGAVAEIAPRFPQVRFVVVGGDVAAAANVVPVGGSPDEVKAAVRAEVVALAPSSPAGG